MVFGALRVALGVVSLRVSEACRRNSCGVVLVFVHVVGPRAVNGETIFSNALCSLYYFLRTNGATWRSCRVGRLKVAERCRHLAYLYYVVSVFYVAQKTKVYSV